eukprot:8101061-Pyramimonas_sp.AAC.1
MLHGRILELHLPAPERAALLPDAEAVEGVVYHLAVFEVLLGMPYPSEDRLLLGPLPPLRGIGGVVALCALWAVLDEPPRRG